MGVLGLDHVNLTVPPALLERLQWFYTDIVGLEPGPRPPFRRPGHWLYAGHQAVLHLTASDSPEPAPRAGHGYDHLALACTDPSSHIQRLDAHGIRYQTDHPPETGLLQLFFTDPAGNGVELTFTNEPV